MDNQENSTKTILGWIGSMINFLFCLYAIYLSIQCNNGVNIGSLLAACCCAPCYVVYRLALGSQGCASF